MLRKSFMFLAALTLAGCAAHAPAATKASGAEPAATPQQRLTNPHVIVNMPLEWTPVDLTRVPRGAFAISTNDALGATILVMEGRVAGSPRKEAEYLAADLSRDGFTCSPPIESADRSVAAFTVTKTGMRGKIAIRSFGAASATRILVMGQWPEDAEANEGGCMAVDAVAADAEYR